LLIKYSNQRKHEKNTIIYLERAKKKGSSNEKIPQAKALDKKNSGEL